MATLFVLDKSQTSFSGGALTTVDNGIDWINHALTLSSAPFTGLEISDANSKFEEGDVSQELPFAQTVGSSTYASASLIEVAFTITVTDWTDSWTLAAIDIDGDPSTIEGFAVLGAPGEFPPTGVPLTVTSIEDGPPATTDYADYVRPEFVPGEVDGTSGDDIIDAPYKDLEGDAVSIGDDVVRAGAGNDNVWVGEGDDTVYGGDGDDILKGDAGNDTLYGDTEGAEGADEVLNFTYAGVEGASIAEESFTQLTGLTFVTVTVDNLGGLVGADIHMAEQYVDTGAGETFNPNSGLRIEGAGNGGSGVSATTDVIFDFDAVPGSGASEEVQNVEFRISDIDQEDFDDRVLVTAYDVDGNEVAVTITPSDSIDQLMDGTLDGTIGTEAAEEAGSALIQIAGPVAKIVINFANAGEANQSVWMTDLHFTTITEDDAGNDILDGGEGDDHLFGMAGDDMLFGGRGADELDGGSGDDTIVLNDQFGFDAITGGEAGETLGDTLDASGMTSGVYLNLTEGDSADGGSGTIDGDGAKASFTQIENINLGSGKDTIVGSSGDDNVDGGAGSDIFNGGLGDDVFGMGQNGVGDSDGQGDLVILKDGFGNDTLTDFDAPEDNGDGTFTGVDVLDVSGLYNGAGYPVRTGDVDVGDDGSGNAILNFPGGETLTLVGITATQAENPAFLVAIGFPSDGIVSGTSGNDFIDINYTGDPDGDFVDNGDAVLPGEVNNDDIILAGAGNDLIFGGKGDDEIYAGTGADDVFVAEGQGVDAIVGGEDAGGSEKDCIILEATGTLGATITYAGSEDGTYAFDAGKGSGVFKEIEVVVSTDRDDTFIATSATGTTHARMNGGDDTFEGGSGGDIVEAGADDDRVDGNGGDDYLYGQAGADTLHGGEGGDYIDGGDDNDMIAGEAGDDILYGGAGIDEIQGGEGADEIYGQDGSDRLEGNAGDDKISGGAGDDSIHGGDGIDKIEGDRGRDSIYGDAGSDYLNGGEGADHLEGGTGDDTLTIGGADTAIGGDGDDVFIYDAADPTIGVTTVIGGEDVEDFSDPTNGGSGDVLDLTGVSEDTELEIRDPEMGSVIGAVVDLGFEEIEQINLGSGDDHACGSFADDRFDAGTGADTVDGGGGDDVIGLGSDSSGNPDGDADIIYFADGDGNDTILDFDIPIDNGDGTYTGVDTLDVSDLTDAGGNPVNVSDVNVATNIFGDAVLSFPNGESITLAGVDPNDVSSNQELHAIGIPCFASGTMIATTEGPRRVETLSPGEKIMTRDNGVQTIRWAGQRYLNPHQLMANPHLRPIRIRAGALGNGLPLRDVCVSPQHKMLLSDVRAEILFGEHEVLVAATHLTHVPGVERAATKDVTYVHIMFDSHEIIMAEGAWTESYQPGPQVLNGMENAQREELYQIFPELREDPGVMPAARMTLKAREASVLLH